MGNVNFDEVRKIAIQNMLMKSAVHGMQHIDRVVEFAKKIAKRECPQNYDDVVVGAYLHDLGRTDDDFNYEHGPKGAQIAEFLIEKHWPWLEKERIVKAIQFHSHGETTKDKLIGAIWDADRLDLTRFGRIIDISYLSTRTGKRMAEENNV